LQTVPEPTYGETMPAKGRPAARPAAAPPLPQAKE